MTKSKIFCATLAVAFLTTANADTIDLYTLWNGQTFDTR